MSIIDLIFIKTRLKIPRKGTFRRIKQQMYSNKYNTASQLEIIIRVDEGV